MICELNKLDKSLYKFTYYTKHEHHRDLNTESHARKNIYLTLKIEFAQFGFIDLWLWIFECKVARFGYLNTSNSIDAIIIWGQFKWMDILNIYSDKFEPGHLVLWWFFYGFYKLQICWKRIKRVALGRPVYLPAARLERKKKGKRYGKAEGAAQSGARAAAA
jgi:hypothetical protein